MDLGTEKERALEINQQKLTTAMDKLGDVVESRGKAIQSLESKHQAQDRRNRRLDASLEAHKAVLETLESKVQRLSESLEAHKNATVEILREATSDEDMVPADVVRELISVVEQLAGRQPPRMTVEDWAKRVRENTLWTNRSIFKEARPTDA